MVQEGFDEGEIRHDIATRVLENLRADASRTDGFLNRSDVTRSYVRKDLNINECAWVEECLLAEGVRIEEEDDTDDDSEDAPPIRTARNQKSYPSAARFMTESEEREAGRAIQLSLRFQASENLGKEDFHQRIDESAQLARRRFVESNVRYVWKLAKKYRRLKHFVPEDIFQEGVLGLMKAVERYDPNRGFRFKTYATWWIEQAISRSIGDLDRTVRLPIHVQETYRKVKKAEKRIAWMIGRTPSQAELAASIGWQPERLAKLLWRVEATNCAEADAPIGDDDVTLLSFVLDEAPLDAFAAVWQSEMRVDVSDALATLHPREERILRMRFGLDGLEERTLEAIGQIFGVTRERIRQIEAKAIRKLKHPSRSGRLRAHLEN
ncbi:sigma-70 family RNA polymerase sigma factor [Agrobacterium rubi]|uniref:Sigma-70 family RNA polymerase sigma factor n=1 Tax=Agrobacterium rubi TaxID=28099 RepID=A0AAE7UNU5_9HYPH|nr:RNA polymerase sigma factor RpoD/SigA [Agrobacterium rubi]NTE86106.1 sigma-70 family RNA polymerase sigma factor [Agrobacterium rubi]NTF02037.1 sigma-70 family RNA polymerase sigma factor [Agrobacterium rubi]NTF36281.1 sigma-70 family RNA polymerase sigma factor [Agrobacterium rubi]QTG01358.1 sigma-70 family RNA polymerase sigma factor [Agrobacterium rubi]